MPQITVSNHEVIEKLKSFAQFRKDFSKNVKATLEHVGYDVDQSVIEKAVSSQVGAGKGPGSPVASTVAIITVF